MINESTNADKEAIRITEFQTLLSCSVPIPMVLLRMIQSVRGKFVTKHYLYITAAFARNCSPLFELKQEAF
jgi:hypothetical protein